MRPSDRSEEQARSRRALKAFLKQSAQDTVTAESLSAAIREYFNNRFGSSLGTLTPEEAGQILERNGVGPDTRARFVTLLRELFQGFFTGQGSRHIDRTRALLSSSPTWTQGR